jgi:hypothetical protein
MEKGRVEFEDPNFRANRNIGLKNPQPTTITNAAFTEPDIATEEIYGDFAYPVAVRKIDLSGITEESVRAELAANFYIVIPTRHSIMRTPELSAKRDILMKMVYRGEISFDLTANDTEQGLIFYNTRPETD